MPLLISLLAIALIVYSAPLRAEAPHPLVQGDPTADLAAIAFPLESIVALLDRNYPFESDETARWEQILPHLQQQVAAARTRSEFREAVEHAFATLGISHLRLHDARHQDPDTIHATGRAHSGLHLARVDDRWWVAQVDPNFPLHATGLRPGFEVTHFNHWKLPSLRQGNSIETIAAAPMANFGPLGVEFRIRALDLAGNPFETKARYAPWEGRWSRPIGNLDSLPVTCEITDFEGIRIIRFSTFVYDVLPEIRVAIQTTPKESGLIFDLRGNPGGMGLMANALAGLLTDRTFQLGTMHMKEGWIGFFADPQPTAFLGSVAVLIDAFSASTSEIFALGLQEAGRARVFGQPSMGAALPSKWVKLDNEWTLQLPIATYRSAKGSAIEGRGVIPDVVLPITQQDLIRGQDPVLREAIFWLQSRSASP